MNIKNNNKYFYVCEEKNLYHCTAGQAIVTGGEEMISIWLNV